VPLTGTAKLSSMHPLLSVILTTLAQNWDLDNWGFFG
jgi:hypothetical protein